MPDYFLSQDAATVQLAINLALTSSQPGHAHAVADVTGLQAALDAKADTSAVTTALAGKADAAATTASLALKANITALDAGLALKAGQDDFLALTTTVSAKADSSAMATALALKLDATSSAFATLYGTAAASGSASQVASATDVALRALADASKSSLTSHLIGELVSTDLTNAKTTLGVVAVESGLTSLTTTVAGKANTASPTFTGTVSGITKAMVGLPNVDNTTDLGKPISTATQAALDLKLNIGVAAGFDFRTNAAWISANPVIPNNTFAFETDTARGLMKRGNGSSVWDSLSYVGVAATALIDRFTEVQATGGATYTALAGLISTFAAVGGEVVEPASVADFQKRDVANVWITPSCFGDSWESVSLPPVAGVITINVGTVPFHRAHSTLVADTTSPEPVGLDGAERIITLTASGGDWLYTPAGTTLLEDGGRGYFLVPSGTSVTIALTRSGGVNYAEYKSRSGDPYAEVVLTPALGTPDILTIPATRILNCFSAALLGDTEVAAPIGLTGQPLLGRLSNSTGGAVAVTFNAGWEQKYGTTGLSIPNGKTVEVLCRRQGSTDIFTVAQVSV